MITTVGLDADDTLWHSEVHFVDVEDRLRSLIESYCPGTDCSELLLQTERANLAVLGYGVKAFTLSMVETAIELTGSRLSASDVHRIIGWGKEMMAHPVELIDGVAETVHHLVGAYEVLIVTKGDLFHQEAKVAESGLANLVHGVEIVSEKDSATYHRILTRRGIEPTSFLMVGNSLRSDVVPVLDVGGHAAHIPYHVTWSLEHEVGPVAGERFHTLSAITDVPPLLERLAERERS